MLWSAVVAHHPGRADRQDALAGCLLSGLREEPGDRSADSRPPPAGRGRHASARPTMLLVPPVGAHAEAAGALRRPAGGNGSEKPRITIKGP